jgi:hypothetical protein
VTIANPGLASCFGKDLSKEIGKYFIKGEMSGGTSPGVGSFLDAGLNDASSLRKKVAELQMEIKKLKSGGSDSASSDTLDNKRNWMSSTGSGSFGNERPTTAMNSAK